LFSAYIYAVHCDVTHNACILQFVLSILKIVKMGNIEPYIVCFRISFLDGRFTCYLIMEEVPNWMQNLRVIKITFFITAYVDNSNED